MRKLFILLFFYITFATCTFGAKTCLAENNYYYTTNVEHLFTHFLIAYPDIAFAKDNNMKKHYDADCITSAEFLNILKSLHKKGYALVSIYDCFETDTNGNSIKKKIKVPVGKKPLILSFDDVNYDQKKLGKGMVDKIIIDSEGNIAASTTFGKHTDISYNKEFICILESFINKNPDFSINGARGTINLTGYDGILGYRTNHSNTKNKEEEIKNAKLVVNKLKNLGWTFASHSYGHYHMKKITLDKFQQELDLWKNEVEPIVGETSIYVYPYGEWEVFNHGDLCEKHKLLVNYGFNLFCGVGMKTFYSYLPNKNGHKVLFMDRKCIDGTTLRANSHELYNFFNPVQILDKYRLK